MRPIHRGDSPQATDFSDYRDAFSTLVGRLGPYCSFCERNIRTNLAVEHIQPKDENLYPELEGKWDNYLLACVNCNSTKGHKDVRSENFYLPDRDNTLAAFEYLADGVIKSRNNGGAVAASTLKLTGLDKKVRQAFDENGKLIATDRISQRMEAWLKAQRSKDRLRRNPSPELIESIVELALSEGFFSVWMTVFEDMPDMRRKFIDGFPGTSKDCFHSATTDLVSPRRTNGLANGGKI
jgi:hypothetical protein